MEIDIDCLYLLWIGDYAAIGVRNAQIPVRDLSNLDCGY